MTSAAEHVLPSVLAGFLQRHPGVDLGLEVGTSERVWALLSSHEADLVIAGRPPAGIDATVHAVRPNELVVVAVPDLAERFDLGAPPGCSVRRARALMSHARPCWPVCRWTRQADPGSNGAVVAGAVAGVGVTMVSRDAVARSWPPEN
ncbi:LysR substrate-binding domain-containing protein [Streptomyces bottropensis]|uniref:LysR substrate-binding domain-containing protein n=1 Tax=Streptomyces bottropensis TaxID=42235 RepID=A0ABU8B265_9ACTN